MSSTFAHDGDGKDLGNAAPAGSGGGGPFARSRTRLLSNLTLDQIGGGGSVLGSDIWGWTDSATQRKFALMGLTNATSFIEVTDPLNPVYLGKLDTAEAGQNRAWRDIKVYNDHAFIVADGSGNDQGIQAFDLQQLLTVDLSNGPVNFTATSHYDDFSSSHNIVINEDTGFGYVVGARDNNNNRLHNGGLVIFDFSDPANITEVGSYSGDGYTHDAQAVIYNGPDSSHVGKEVVFACNEDTLTIVDVTDKSNTVLLSRDPYPESSYSHQGWLSEDHKYLYLNDELDEYNHARGPDGQFGTDDDGDPIPTRTHMWDVQDLDAPTYMGFYDGAEKTIDHNLYVKGDFIYQANYSSGLRILKINDAATGDITEYGFFDTFMADNNVSFNGAWSCYPYFDDDTVLISDRQGGLFVVQAVTSSVVDDQLVFYNESSFDSDDPGTGLEDLLAVAPDKVALLPGQTGSFANYTSSDKGITGIMVEIHGARSDISLADFEFTMGPDSDIANWPTAPAPNGFVFDEGVGLDPDRITITWAAGDVTNTWLRVNVLSNIVTGLPEDSVFFFGNVVGETGNSTSDTRVNLIDVGLIRTNQSGFSGALINDPYDINRDGRVNLVDVGLTRANQTGFTSIDLISPDASGNRSAPSSKGAAAAKGAATRTKSKRR
jgi:choice-of-anchor B domain-containing protein